MQLLKQATLMTMTLVSGAASAADPSALASLDGRHAPAPHISKPASEESIEQLLQITGMHKLLDENLRQVDERVAAGLQRGIAGRNLTPEQEAIMLRMRDKISAVVKDTVSWEAMEPVSVRIYREALTQDELDGMLAFYKTPAGEAVIKKLPRLSQEMSQEMQRMLQAMMPKLMAIAKESEDEMELSTPASDSSNHSADAQSPSGAPSSIRVPLQSPVPSTNPSAAP
jgi:hypothetical protein